ncbi:site-specific integrase [Bacillus cereus group sp. BfR-BA-01119]|uniref:tyrosine-type recombinase/integrase n=1 Tax=unclassified Bacillus cereus group TaxID=2750818 RepID=UPI0007722D6E|nr:MULTISPECIES: site-specific integrase [unclassified Bacillus cereus group]MDX5868848.1 site-specific integrase [Bacillus cereus group sp. BfR-BA-01119]MDX5960094.1 site-specific integrase [Bacillus cereus group sp. BfR-BA-00331]
MSVIPFIDFESDKWIIPARADMPDYVFRFDFLPNVWFNQTVKKTTLESFTIARLSVGTLHRYNYGLEMFFKFVDDCNICLRTFSDLTPIIIEQYISYLLLEVDKPSTRNGKMAALKHQIRHGQMLGWGKFPSIEIFDGTENRTLQTEDTLKTMVIDDCVMKQIDVALMKTKQEMKSVNQICTWGLISLIRHTGIRIHEALRIQETHLSRDFGGNQLLEIVSDKTLTDRYLPVSQEVVNVIKRVSEATRKGRGQICTERIFINEQKRSKEFQHLSQVMARQRLASFITTNNIVDPNGILVKLTYHQFRHTIGTDLLNNGMSISEVMEYLGHTSTHSTRLYAKVRNDRLSREYRKLGFIGVIEEKVDNVIDEQGGNINKEQRLMAQLPDGVCARPIKEKVNHCKKPNACLFCPKFITTPEFLDFHTNHLERIREDKQRYMQEHLIGTDYLLFETEQALAEIISQLKKF